jgi:hypothetical protein
MTYTKVMTKQPYCGYQTPSFIPARSILVPSDGCKNLSLPCGVNEMQFFFLEFQFASQIGDHL